MKYAIKSALSLVLFSLGNLVWGQDGKFDVQIIFDSFNAQNAKITFELQLRASHPDSTFAVADQNYRLYFDTLLVKNPVIAEELTFSGSGIDPYGLSYGYAVHNLNGSADSLMSYNIEMIGGDGYTVEEGWLGIGKVEFDFVGTDSSIFFNWLTSADIPSTSVNEKFNNQLFIVNEGIYKEFLAACPTEVLCNSPQFDCIDDLTLLVDSTYSYYHCTPSGMPFNESYLPIHELSISSPTAYTSFTETSEGRYNIQFDPTALAEDSLTFTLSQYSYCPTPIEKVISIDLEPTGLFPGDVNNDLKVEWASDASAFSYAYANAQTQLNLLGEYRNNCHFDFASGIKKDHDWFEQYSKPWFSGSVESKFAFNTDSLNMKHADCDGNTVLEYEGSVGYSPADPLNDILFDMDVIAHYDYEQQVVNAQFTASQMEPQLKIRSLDSVINADTELRLLVEMGSVEQPISDVHSLAFLVEFSYGTYENPFVKLDSSNLDIPSDLRSTDYPMLTNPASDDLPQWYIVLGRDDLQGANFSGEEVCRIECVATIIGLWSGPAQSKADFAEYEDVVVTIKNSGYIDSNGNYFPLIGDSISIPVVDTFFPLELLKFEGDSKGTHIELNWETASEYDFDGFELQRSEDGESFKEIAWIQGTNLENQQASYLYNDANVIKNKAYYYRLKMIDLDGGFKYSNIVSVAIGDEHYKPFNIYPNPITDELSMNFMIMDKEEGITIEIYDALGGLKYKEELFGITGENLFNIELDHLASGFYFLHVKHNAYIFSEALIKH